MKPRDRILAALDTAAPYGVAESHIGSICNIGSWRLRWHLRRLERDMKIKSVFQLGPHPRIKKYSIVLKGADQLHSMGYK